MSFAIASVVIGGIGVISSLSAGKKASKAAKQQGQAQAQTEQKVTTERLRQIERQEMLTREATQLGAAGSGVKIESRSVLEVLADQQAEFAKESSITQQVGASAAKAALDRGKAIGTQAKYQGYSGALGGISNIFSILGKKYG